MGAKQSSNNHSGKQSSTSATAVTTVITSSPLFLLQSGNVIDKYPIKLSSMQSAMLFDDLLTAKKTLTWKDVVKEKNITFRKCVDLKIDIQKLYNMQPDIEEWIKYDKVKLQDCKDMELWRPNPFYHFKCHIGDLVVHKKHLSPNVLINGGVKFNILWERYGLTPELMVILKYSPEDWIRLGITEDYLSALSDTKHWTSIFQNLKRKEVVDAIRYYQGKRDENHQDQPSTIEQKE